MLSNYGSMLALLVMALFTTPALTHGLGPERFGIWAMVGAIIPYLEVLELGFASTTVAMVTRHMASGESDRVKAILNTSFFLLMIPGLICFVIACAIAVILPHVAHIDPSQVRDTQILVLLLGFDMAVSIPADTFGGVLIARHRFDLLNASLACVTLLQALSWIIILRLGGGLVALGVATVAVSLLGQVARFVMFKKLLPDFHVTRKGFDRQLVRSFARLSGWFSFGQVVNLAVDAIDVVIVGIVVGVTQAGIFAVGQRLAMLAANTVSPVSSLFMPASADRIGRGDAHKLRSMVITGNRVVMGVAVPAALVTAVLARPALLAWVGSLYVQAAPVAVLFCATVVVRSSTQTSRSVLSGAAEPMVPVTLNAIALGLHIALAVILGQHIGMDGVAWAVLVSSLIFDGAAMMIVVSRRYDVGVGEYLVDLGRVFLIPSICAGAVGLYLAIGPLWDFVLQHVRAIGILAVILAGLVMLGIYLPVYAFSGFTSSERSQVIGRIRSFLRASE